MLLRCRQRNRGHRGNRNARGERRAGNLREGPCTPINAKHSDRGGSATTPKICAVRNVEVVSHHLNEIEYRRVGTHHWAPVDVFT
jgi:hypothetical protein